MHQAPRITSLSPAATEWLEAIGAPVEALENIDGLSSHPGLLIVPPRLVAAAREALGGRRDDARVHVFEEETLKQVLDGVLHLARVAGVLPRAMQILGDGEARLRQLHGALGGLAEAASEVAVLRSIGELPPEATWIADVVRLAGGRLIDDVAVAETLVVALPGVDARDAAIRLSRPEAIAAHGSRSFVIDGSRYLSRPGPSVYRAVELVAFAIHGEQSGVTTEADELVPVEAAASVA